LNITSLEIEQVAAAALRDQTEALKLVDSLKERLNERELKGIMLAIKSVQSLTTLSAEHCNSLEETMSRIKEIPMLDAEDRIYAEFIVILLKLSGVKKSNIKAEGDEPKDEGSYNTMSVGLSSGSPSSESGYYNTEHVEEQEEDEP